MMEISLVYGNAFPLMAHDTQWPIIIGATSQGTPHQFLTGQSGEVWVDEVRIYDYALNQFEVAKLSKPISSRICIEKIIGDLNNDCKVDLNDFILLSDSWLKDKSVDLALLEPIPLAAVDINDSFWTPKLQTYYNVTIDDVFTKFENDRGGAFNNFDRVFNGQSGYHAGPEWYDGLLYETIRGASDMLITHYSHTFEDRPGRPYRTNSQSRSSQRRRLYQYLDATDGTGSSLGRKWRL